MPASLEQFFPTVDQLFDEIERALDQDADGITVGGNIQSQGGAGITVRNASVDGDIQLEQGGSAEVTASEIDGDIQWESQSGLLVA